MKKIILTLVFLCFVFVGVQAQYTSIPDNEFEQALIDLGLDDVIDGQVLTSNINTVTELDLWGYSIQDLTGIQDFTALQILDCSDNYLTALDVSANTQLFYLVCGYNLLTEIDVSNNPNLVGLLVDGNPITELDISNNLSIFQLWCDFTSISALDLSNHTSLQELYCGDNNSLTELNLKNGTNNQIIELDATGTPNLNCIQVDDEVAANNGDFPYSYWEVDGQVIYAEDCTLGVEDRVLFSISIFPNPATKVLQINNPINVVIKQVQVYNLLGKEVLQVQGNNNTINVSGLLPGVYFVKLITQEGVRSFKMVKE